MSEPKRPSFMLLLYNESVYVRSSDYLAKVAHKEDEEVVFICMLDCVSIGRDSRSF